METSQCRRAAQAADSESYETGLQHNEERKGTIILLSQIGSFKSMFLLPETTIANLFFRSVDKREVEAVFVAN